MNCCWHGPTLVAHQQWDGPGCWMSSIGNWQPPWSVSSTEAKLNFFGAECLVVSGSTLVRKRQSWCCVGWIGTQKGWDWGQLHAWKTWRSFIMWWASGYGHPGPPRNKKTIMVSGWDPSRLRCVETGVAMGPRRSRSTHGSQLSKSGHWRWIWAPL